MQVNSQNFDDFFKFYEIAIIACLLCGETDPSGQMDVEV
jgi:hypothetical protein